MSKPILFSAVAVGLLIGLAAWQRPPSVAATPAAPPAANQPQLWSIQVMNGETALSRVDICADAAVRKSFSRPSPEINGRPCVRVKAPYEKAGAYSMKCRMDDHLYRVGSVTSGDTARDFTVAMTAKRQDRKEPIFEQVRRYRLVGACPTGWHIGESAAPGAKQLLDTLSGRPRPMPPSGG
jgi:hypothetical protein